MFLAGCIFTVTYFDNSFLKLVKQHLVSLEILYRSYFLVQTSIHWNNKPVSF